MEDFLLEIGCEEIPASYIRPALDALKAGIGDFLDQSRISFGEIKTYGTPRRLAVYVSRVAPRQEPKVIEQVGPPRRVAFDDSGKPTVAAVKFAQRAGVPVSRLVIKETPRGPYVAAVIKDKGKATTSILRDALPGIILSLPFPKKMRWAGYKIAFARPIRWIVAMYGKRVVPFSVGPVKSGRYTRGLRFSSNRRMKISHPCEYVKSLSDAGIVCGIEDRISLLEKAIREKAKEAGGRVIEDKVLLEEVSCLVESCQVLLGTFDPDFLALPREILVTAMKEHQRYFALEGDSGLLPGFIVVNNTPVRDPAVSVKGHERVLRARLEDARFFYENDVKVPLDQMVGRLKDVIFQQSLGSMFDKTCRIVELVSALCRKMGCNETEHEHARRAAYLSKADLVSQVVYEFPSLQGVMGRIYAQKQGEPDDVAIAIEEHYRPVHSRGALPKTRTGIVVALADKLDTLSGCFHAGLIPTGAADPYGLRRQAIGVIQILKANDISLDLVEIIKDALIPFSAGDAAIQENTAKSIHSFVVQRIAGLLEEEGIPKDLVAAVLSAGNRDIPDVWARARGLLRLKQAPDFADIAVSFKRVKNILSKADPAEVGGATLDPGLLRLPEEKELYARSGEIQKAVAQHIENKEMDAAFQIAASIRPVLDRFFDAVLVMDPDISLRKNRLALLGTISAIFERLADFSRIST